MSDSPAIQELTQVREQLAHVFKTMSTIEMMCENLNVKHHVEEWETRCLKAEQQLATARQALVEVRTEMDQLKQQMIEVVREERQVFAEEATAHLEAQRTLTYQAVAREHEAKRQLAQVTQERDDYRKRAEWKRVHDDSLELELQKQLATACQIIRDGFEVVPITAADVAWATEAIAKKGQP